MSYNLYIWETPAHWKAPAKLQEAAKYLQALEQTNASVNPKLQELARQLAALHPSMDSQGEDVRDAVWINNPVKQVERMEHAVWVLGLPDEDRVTVLCQVVQAATALGLTVLDDQMGMVFLPSGKVLPANKRILWEGVQEHVENAPPIKVTKAQLRKKMLGIFTPILLKHGFEMLDKEALKAYRMQDYVAVRPVQGGEQTIMGSLDGEPSEFRFVIFCRLQNFEAMQIAKDILNRGHIGGGGGSIEPQWFIGQEDDLPVNTDEEIVQAMALFEDKVMPVLDLAKDIKGLDRVMNDPTLFTRVPTSPRHIHNSISSYIRHQGTAPLTIARLAGNPQFEEVVQAYEESHKIIFNDFHAYTPEDFAKLVKYLREEVKPVA